jgi:hypothetical protein
VGNVVSGIFSRHCYNKMLGLFNKHDDEVGSESDAAKSPSARRGRKLTNCFIYVYNVLNYAYTQSGKLEAAKSLKPILIGGNGFKANNGTRLAKHLVSLGWKAHYWNPDVFDPRDKDIFDRFNPYYRDEHSTSFLTAKNTKKYYGVSVSGMIVGYNKTKRSTWSHPFDGEVKKPSKAKNIAAFNDFTKVEFAVGIARGATHCFLVSKGKVREVHYDQSDPKTLYGTKIFRVYEYLSGIVLTPPDSTYQSRPISEIIADEKADKS